MQIANNILKHQLQHVYFITGTACAGKSTAVQRLAQRYGLVPCGENYHSALSDRVADPLLQPNISWLNNLTDWREFVTRPPEEYARWIADTAREAAQYEVALLLSMPRDKKIIVDTNIPPELLREISDCRRVAVMLAPQSMSVDRFFDREDPDKRFLLDVIGRCPDPEAVMDNYRRGLALINSPERYAEYANSGFFTLVRPEDGTDTREEVCAALARHFGLEK